MSNKLYQFIRNILTYTGFKTKIIIKDKVQNLTNKKLKLEIEVRNLKFN